MDEESGRPYIIKIVLVCILWYATSSTNNVVGKMVLTSFPYPMTVTMAQLTSITLYSGPFLKYMKVPSSKHHISYSYYKRIIIPLAFGKFITSVLSHVSLWKVPVSYAHTVKASMPLFTVFLGRILFGEQPGIKIYVSLAPIVIGVALSTITELSFNYVGLVAALLATCGFALQNIFAKKVLIDTGMHHLNLLFVLGKLSLLMFLPVWVLCDGYSIAFSDSQIPSKDVDSVKILGLLALDGALNWLQNVLAFTVMHLVSPLTYAVANATKRICVISLSILLLRNPVTIANVMGMSLAIFGVISYNKAKYDAVQEKKREALASLGADGSWDLRVKTANGYVTQAPYFPNPLQTAPFDTLHYIDEHYNRNLNDDVHRYYDKSSTNGAAVSLDMRSIENNL